MRKNYPETHAALARELQRISEASQNTDDADFWKNERDALAEKMPCHSIDEIQNLLTFLRLDLDLQRKNDKQDHTIREKTYLRIVELLTTTADPVRQISDRVRKEFKSELAHDGHFDMIARNTVSRIFKYLAVTQSHRFAPGLLTLYPAQAKRQTAHPTKV